MLSSCPNSSLTRCTGTPQKNPTAADIGFQKVVNHSKAVKENPAGESDEENKEKIPYAKNGTVPSRIPVFDSTR